MREMLKKIVILEKTIGEIAEENEQYKVYYDGYLKGLREAKSILLDLIFNKQN